MDFDLNTGRSIMTVVALVTFIGIILWAYSRKNASQFEEAAKLPFEQD